MVIYNKIIQLFTLTRMFNKRKKKIVITKK